MNNTLFHNPSLSPALSISMWHLISTNHFILSCFVLLVCLIFAFSLVAAEPPSQGTLQLCGCQRVNKRPDNKEWAATWTVLIRLLADTSHACSLLVHTHTCDESEAGETQCPVWVKCSEWRSGGGETRGSCKINHNQEREGQRHPDQTRGVWKVS